MSVGSLWIAKTRRRYLMHGCSFRGGSGRIWRSGTRDGVHSGPKDRKSCLARPRRMGDLHRIRQRECAMNGASGISRSGGRVVLVGNDGLGVRVLQELCELGIKVTAVCAGEQTPFARAARDARVSLIIGNPELEETLKEAGIEEASACGLLVDSDLTNLHVALELLELAPRARVVLRLFNISLAGAIHGLLGDVTVLSATELAAPAFVEAALRGSVGFELRAGDRQVAVQEVDGGDPNLWLALAEAESEEGEPRIFPVDAARVVGIVDRGPAEATGQDPSVNGRPRHSRRQPERGVSYHGHAPVADMVGTHPGNVRYPGPAARDRRRDVRTTHRYEHVDVQPLPGTQRS